MLHTVLSEKDDIKQHILYKPFLFILNIPIIYMHRKKNWMNISLSVNSGYVWMDIIGNF